MNQAHELGVASVDWHYDDEPYEQEIVSDEEAREKFDSHEWTGPYGCVVRVEGLETPVSLWGIVLGPRELDDPYARVIVAELASEVMDELRQAVGDVLDEQLCPA